jgi:hypothetical protein
MADKKGAAKIFNLTLYTVKTESRNTAHTLPKIRLVSKLGRNSKSNEHARDMSRVYHRAELTAVLNVSYRVLRAECLYRIFCRFHPAFVTVCLKSEAKSVLYEFVLEEDVFLSS